MKRKNIYSLMEAVYGGRSLSGQGRAIGGGAAQYIVNKLVQQKLGNKFKSAQTAGVSKTAPDVLVTFKDGTANTQVAIEVKYGGGTFDLKKIINGYNDSKGNPIVVPKNGSAGKTISKKAFIDKIKRDGYLLVTDGGGTKKNPSMGMTKARILRITDSNPDHGIAPQKKHDKMLFGVDIAEATSAQVEKKATNPSGNTRTDSTRIERSITWAKMKELGATEIGLTSVMSAEDAHVTFVRVFLQQNKSAVAYRKQLADYLGTTAGIRWDEQLLLTLMSAMDSAGSSAFSTCWNASKGVYLPIIPDRDESKNNKWYVEVKKDMRTFMDNFEEITGKKFTQRTTMKDATGSSGTLQYNAPDTTDKALQDEEGSPDDKKEAKKELIKDYEAGGPLKSIGEYLGEGDEVKREFKRLIAAFNKGKKDSQKISGHYNALRQGKSPRQIISELPEDQRLLLADFAAQAIASTNTSEDPVVVEENATEAEIDNTIDHLAAIRQTTKYGTKSRVNQYIGPTMAGIDTYDGKQGYTAKKRAGDWSDSKYSKLVSKLDALYPEWKQAIPTPYHLARMAHKKNRLDINDIQALLKRESKMRNYSIASVLLENEDVTYDTMVTQTEMSPMNDYSVQDALETIEQEPVPQEPVQDDTQQEELEVESGFQTDAGHEVLSIELDSLPPKGQIELALSDIAAGNGALAISNDLLSILNQLLQMPSDLELDEPMDIPEDTGMYS